MFYEEHLQIFCWLWNLSPKPTIIKISIFSVSVNRIILFKRTNTLYTYLVLLETACNIFLFIYAEICFRYFLVMSFLI